MRKHPIYRIFIPFITGILIALYPFFYLPVPFILLIIILCILLTALFISSKFITYRYRWLNGFILSISFAFIGYYITVDYYDIHKPQYFGNYIPSSKTFVVGNICEPVKIKDKSVKTIVKILYVADKEKLIKTIGKALIYLEKDSITTKLKYGDMVFINAQFHEIPAPQNPGDINYKRYFAFKNIYHKAYVRSGDINLLSTENGNYIFKYAYLVRDKFVSIFKQNNISGKELAVGSSIIFGYRDLLDADTIMEYSMAGVIHILCVSGLNVGIIFLIFSNLLFFLDRFKHEKIIKSLLLLLIVWSYTFICGLSPSILRASVMFTFIITGKLLRREVNALNAVIASAFILLLFDPFLITNLGFQLSYLSVIGIVVIYPFINKLWAPVNKIILKIWELIAVSLSAQTLIFPVVIYYYYYFPDYFIFTNLIVIPLVFLITYAGMIILAIYPIIGTFKLFSLSFIYLIKILNFIVKSIEHAPFSVIKPITINSYELFLIYVVLLFILFAVINKNKIYLKLSLLTSMILVILLSFRAYNNLTQKKFIVYSVRKSSAYDFINGKHHVLIADNCDSTQLSHLISQQNIAGFKNLRDLFLRNDNLYIKDNFIQFYDKRIAIINNENYTKYALQNMQYKIHIDYLILSDNIKTDINNLMASFDAKQIIFDSSNSTWKINKWIDECKKLNTNYYSVPHSGAFILDL
jgi:competence protein ComEC